jgi:hypothetical protein
MASGRVKTSHHAQFDEAWYLQPSRPPAPQLLYDLGVRPAEDSLHADVEVGLEFHDVGAVQRSRYLGPLAHQAMETRTNGVPPPRV